MCSLSANVLWGRMYKLMWVSLLDLSQSSIQRKIDVMEVSGLNASPWAKLIAPDENCLNGPWTVKDKVMAMPSFSSRQQLDRRCHCLKGKTTALRKLMIRANTKRQTATVRIFNCCLSPRFPLHGESASALCQNQTWFDRHASADANNCWQILAKPETMIAYCAEIFMVFSDHLPCNLIFVIEYLSSHRKHFEDSLKRLAATSFWGFFFQQLQ